GDWYQLANGAWIAAFLVEGAPGNLAVAEIPAAPVVEGVPAATPAVQAQPSGGQAFTCIDGCAEPPDPACAIKGNVNSSGEKIYHSPGGQFYDRTDIKPEEGDRWFCTSEEARQAGFRASQR